jgi:CBS domain-containing protein
MRVRDGMSEVVLTVRPQHTLRDAAKAMASRGLGAAVVIDPDQPGPGIITERDLLESVGAGQSPDAERVADHLSSNLTFATPDWSLERAAEAMVRGGFRHLVVVDGSEMVGIVSMRDIVRCWVSEGATSEMPGAVASG